MHDYTNQKQFMTLDVFAKILLFLFDEMREIKLKWE